MTHAASCNTAHDLISQLQEIVGDARKVQSRWWMVRYLSATYYTKRIESWVKKLDQHINDLSVSVNQ